MNRLRILIVGSGPSAFGLLMCNQIQTLKIQLIDNSKNLILKEEGCQFKKEFMTGNRKIRRA